MSDATDNNNQNARQAQSTTTTQGGGASPATTKSSTKTTNKSKTTTNFGLPPTGTTSTRQSSVNTLPNNPTQTLGTGATTPSVASSATSSSATTSAAAANSTQVPNAGDEDMGYSTGALAGAIVGSIIGAAIITFLVTWLFFGKRNKRDQHVQRSVSDRSRSHRSTAGHGTPKVVGAGVAEKSSSSSGDSGLGWQAYLPQSADDKTVQRDVKTLFDQIELHVDNYYTKANVRLDSATREGLSLYDDGNLPASVESLIANPQTTLPTIKHCIAKVLIERMSPGFEGGASLLPAYLTSEPTKLKSSMPPGESTAAQQAYSQWRLLNAYLHPQPEKDRSYQQHREQAAHEISEQFSTTFAPWQGPKENLEGLKQHEKSLVVRAGDVGCLIMSQPSAYDFRWNPAHSTSGRSFVVFPGFTKTTDERGLPLEQQQSLVSPILSRA